MCLADCLLFTLGRRVCHSQCTLQFLRVLCTGDAMLRNQVVDIVIVMPVVVLPQGIVGSDMNTRHM
jgi:hypothetical protein